MLEAAFDVEALAVGFREDPGSRDVHRNADGRYDGHQRAGDIGRTDQPANRLVDDERAQDEQDGPVRLAAQHLGAPHAVGEVTAARPLDNADDEERKDERAGVGQHVPGVGEQRERMRQDPDDDLEGHEAGDQHERDRQVAPVRIGSDRVRVARAVVVVGMIVIVAVLVAVVLSDHTTKVTAFDNRCDTAKPSRGPI